MAPLTSGVTTPPPLSPYGTLTGQLFLYAGNRAAFESSSPSVTAVSTSSSQSTTATTCPNKCILLGGLSDGLLPTPYTSSLEQACAAKNWSLVQPLLSSSYTGFGHGRLERDTAELDDLFLYLSAHRDCQRLAIVGHSTGCQNIVHYLKHGNPTFVEKIAAVALQAPVSDREHAAMEDEDAYQRNLQTALDLKTEGKEEELMPRSAFWAPMTAQRFLDLNERGGADDFFSSDYSDDELNERLSHVGALHSTLQTCLVAFSGADEYVPTTVNSRELTDRLVKAMNSKIRSPSSSDITSGKPVAESLYLETGNHSLSQGSGDADVFVRRVADILGNVVSPSS